MKNVSSINACGWASLFINDQYVGRCLDTPNAVAYGMVKTGATRSTSWLFNRTREDLSDRIAFNGWMKTDSQAHLVKA